MTKNKYQSLLSQLYYGRKLALQIMKRKVHLMPRNFPLRVECNVTARCNLECKHCYVSSKSNISKDPSLDKIKNLIDEVYNRGCRWFRVMGGEPLLRDDIGDIINYAKNKGMYIEIATNGLLIEKRIEELKNVDTFVISLDGNEETHDRLRGKGTYKKTIAGLNAAIENGLRPRLHAVLTPLTVSSVNDMIKLSKKYNININFGEAAGGKDWEKEHKFFNEDDLISYYKQYRTYKKQGVNISNTYTAIDYIMKWPWKDKRTIYQGDKELLEKNNFKIIPCMMGRLSTFIDADGGVYPCPKLWGKGLNCYEHGFDKAWEHLNNLKCISCREIGCVDVSLILIGDIPALIKGAFRFA